MSIRVAAIIPAKGYSRRVPGKNLRSFLGKPLVAHTIEQALAATMVDDVFVSTDDERIREVAVRCGACVPFMRAPDLAADSVHGSVAILDMLERVGGAATYAFCVSLLPTTPLRTARTIDGVVRLACESGSNVLSVTSTGRTGFHLRTIAPSGDVRLLIPEFEGIFNIQAGDLPEVFALSAAAQCAPVPALFEHRTFQYGSPKAYVVDPVEATDIDTERDFEIAERLAGLV